MGFSKEVCVGLSFTYITGKHFGGGGGENIH